MSDKLSGENKDGFIKKLYKISVKVITLFLCGLAIYVIYSVGSFLFNWNSSGGVVQWGVLKIGGYLVVLEFTKSSKKSLVFKARDFYVNKIF